MQIGVSESIQDDLHQQGQEQLLELASTLLLELNALQTLVAKEQIEEQTALLRTGLDEAEQRARTMVQVLRSSAEGQTLPEVQGITLAEALTRLLEETAERQALASRLSLSGVDDQGRSQSQELSKLAEGLLYTIAREALEQVQYHSEARRIKLSLSYGADEVQLSIEDDGHNQAHAGEGEEFIDELPAPPFVAPEPRFPFSGQAFYTQRQRIRQFGGSLEVEALGEKGNRVQVRIPYVQPIAREARTTENLPVVRVSEAQQTISVLVVDRQAVIRAALNRLLESYSGLHVVGEAADGVQAVSETLELGPQVVLMDAQLPEGQSLEALRQIKQLNLNTRVLFFVTQEREEYLYEALRAGADGYVLKDIAPDELVEAIQVVARGEVLIQPQLASRLLSRVGRGRSYETLTTRELEVLRLLARGLRNKEIAARLYVSERTVNFHLANIYQKLNVSGRTEALSKALEQGLV